MPEEQKPKRNIDERIDALTDRIDALTMNVELFHHDMVAAASRMERVDSRMDKFDSRMEKLIGVVEIDAENIRRLASIAEAHDQRLTDVGGRQQQ
jgi:DNA repair ATPase RecN